MCIKVKSKSYENLTRKHKINTASFSVSKSEKGDDENKAFSRLIMRGFFRLCFVILCQVLAVLAASSSMKFVEHYV